MSIFDMQISVLVAGSADKLPRFRDILLDNTGEGGKVADLMRISSERNQ